MDTKEIVNKRQYFRVTHEIPLCASMTLFSVKGKLVTTRSTYVCVRNISAGGLCFWSDLSLPVIDTAIYSFKVKIMETNLVLYGTIVRSNPIKDNITEFGVKFTEEHNNTSEISKIINLWSIALTKKKMSELKFTCSLCSKKSIEECFASRKS